MEIEHVLYEEELLSDYPMNVLRVAKICGIDTTNREIAEKLGTSVFTKLDEFVKTQKKIG